MATFKKFEHGGKGTTTSSGKRLNNRQKQDFFMKMGWFLWVGNVERMELKRISKRLYNNKSAKLNIAGRPKLR